ncbi:uncharacterized protein F5147DRAFT_657117 [Suillus discolor]|uniref:Uncharacterized protein n=1 Tax=Suillus discolor TaxID=1912936 RepID=A0A9P7JNS3_9AGAM|nr:uncharacterized protein F5147DRAFT_657117 [Suillus discolor]KAG2094641.1 hypothetical protein F5147DRAFT_657117 [Suillus discolor]
MAVRGRSNAVSCGRNIMEPQLRECYLFSDLSPSMMPISGLLSLDTAFDFVGYVSIGEQKSTLFPLYLKQQICLIGYIATPIMHNGIEIVHHSVYEPGSMPIYTQHAEPSRKLDLAPQAYMTTDHILYVKYDWPTLDIQKTTAFLAEFPQGRSPIDIAVALSQLFQPFQTSMISPEFNDYQPFQPPLIVPEPEPPVFDILPFGRTLIVPEVLPVVDSRDPSVNMTGCTTNLDDVTQPEAQQADGPDTLSVIQEQYAQWKTVLVHLRVEMTSDVALGKPINLFLFTQANYAKERAQFVGKWLSALLSLMKRAASIAIADGGLMTNFTLQNPCPFALQSEICSMCVQLMNMFISPNSTHFPIATNDFVWFLGMGIAKSLVYYLVYWPSKSANVTRIMADINRPVFRDASHLPPATLAFAGTCCYSALLSYLIDMVKTGGVTIDLSQFPSVSEVYDGLLGTATVLFAQEDDPDLPSSVGFESMQVKLWQLRSTGMVRVNEQARLQPSDRQRTATAARTAVAQPRPLNSLLPDSLLITASVLFGWVDPLDLIAILHISLRVSAVERQLQQEEYTSITFLVQGGCCLMEQRMYRAQMEVSLFSKAIANVYEELNTQYHPPTCQKKILREHPVVHVGTPLSVHDDVLSVDFDRSRPSKATREKCEAWLSTSWQFQTDFPQTREVYEHVSKSEVDIFSEAIAHTAGIQCTNDGTCTSSGSAMTYESHLPSNASDDDWSNDWFDNWFDDSVSSNGSALM